MNAPKWTFFAGALALVLSASAPAGNLPGGPSNRLNVANDGVDAAGCGTRAAPCRTIGHAISLAAPNDTILVGPGVYGDVDRNGVPAGVGEETPGSIASLRVDKPLRLLSTHGAVNTTIVGFDNISTTVEIDSDGVTFGSPRQGFTVIAGHFYGVVVLRRTNVKVAGNIVTAASASGILAATTGICEVSDNDVHGNAFMGIIASNVSNQAGVLVRRNRVYSNSVGIYAQPSGPTEISHNEVSNNAEDGISVASAAIVVYRNVVTSNGRGILVGNGWSESHPPGSGPLIVRNTVTGSLGVAIYFNGGPMQATLRANNIYGNGLAPGELFGNCAFANYSGFPVNATGTYWGASTGPGTDPADRTCGPNPVETTPFATRPN